jgi:hypothetical protein
MCTEYRLSVTPEKIVVQDRDNRGHFLQWWAAGAMVCTASLQLCRIATQQEIKGKERQERNRFKGHCKQSAFYSKISYAMASWLHEIDRRGYNECFTSIT